MAVGGLLYALGGQNPLSAGCEVWNPATDAWRRLPDMPDAVYRPSAILSPDGRYLLVIGGEYGYMEPSTRLHCLDLLTEQWSTALNEVELGGLDDIRAATVC